MEHFVGKSVALSVLILLYCGSEGISIFNPPIINVASPEIDISSNSTLELQCAGKHPLAWKLPHMWAENISERLTVKSYEDQNRIVNKYFSELRVVDTEFLDTGRYVCYYNTTGSDSFSPENATSIYVFVNDDEELFVPNPNFGHILFSVVKPSIPTRVECLPTNSKTNVTLWKIKNDEESEQVMEGTDVLYDPTHGFILLYPNIYFSGLFQCRGILDQHKGLINITFYYLPDSQHLPQPFIDVSGAKYPVVNDSFFLSCSVKVEPSTMVRMEWKYPNKGSSRIIETNATMKERKNSQNYVYKEVTQKLIVNDVKQSDTGAYICLVTDHSQKHNSFETYIAIHVKTQTHVNFTTDIEKGKAMMRQVGEEVKMVVTVSVFPDLDAVQMYWEKDGKLLKKGLRHHIKNTSNQVILLITKLERLDAGNYTLFGKTDDEILTNISFQLLVRATPSVRVDNKLPYYKVGHHHHFSCHVEGFPLPKVWWKWKPCNRPDACSPESFGGWTDVESDRFLANNETLSATEVRGVDTVVFNLTVHPIYSGYYMCSGANDLGFDYENIALIVTEDANGFEVNATALDIVDQDDVTLTCRASIFNYSKVLWSWKPFDAQNSIPIIDNDPHVQLLSLQTPYSHLLMLKFHGISTNDSGQYICTAWNLNFTYHWQKSMELHVQNIIVPHVFQTNMNGGTKDVEPASQYIFDCEVDGNPEPTITWYKDGELYDVSNMSGVELVDDDQRLIIKRVVDSDSGMYKCMAWNRGGAVELTAALNVLKSDLKPSTNTALIGIICAVIVSSVILFIVAIILVKKICKERKEKKEMEFFSHALFNRGQVEMFNPDMAIDDQVDLLPYDPKWEFPKERLKLGKTLGQGAFGRVVKAEAIGLDDGETKSIVAVKMLKERADSSQRKALMAELKILIHIGSHVNIVNLLGAVTKNLAKGELMVMMEYCCYGNLRNFLLRHRSYFLNQVDRKTGKIDPEISNLPSSPLGINDKSFAEMGWSNPTYGQGPLNYADLLHDSSSNNFSGHTTEPASPTSPTMSEPSFGETMGRGACCQLGRVNKHMISTSNLMCYAFQCANGMAYLSSRKLIHRDLAARNILLAEDNIVKICDFGLAKDCYKYSNYVKKGDGPLPIKWMAVESIGDKIFTTKSDVWSFGILLWEFFTLGGNPYPGIEIDENFYKKLRSGYVMEKPNYAPADVYQIMMDCWNTEPERRPSFSDLGDKLGSFLEDGLRKYYVELNNPYMELNSQMLNDYLCMTNEKTDYLSMNCSQDADQSPQQHYDNISSVRPVGNGPVPTEPMEVVPMIQLDWSESDKQEADSGPGSPTSDFDHSDYLVMGGSNPTDFDRTRKENISTRSDASSGFHSDLGSNVDSQTSAPPVYNLVLEDIRQGVPV